MLSHLALNGNHILGCCVCIKGKTHERRASAMGARFRNSPCLHRIAKGAWNSCLYMLYALLRTKKCLNCLKTCGGIYEMKCL